MNNYSLLMPPRPSAPTAPVAAPMQHTPSTPAMDTAREQSAKKAVDLHLSDSFNSYYEKLTPSQKSGFAPATTISPSLSINGVAAPGGEAESQAIAESVMKMNARRHFMQDIKKPGSTAGSDLIPVPIGPTESGKAMGAPGLPPVTDDIRKAHADLDQTYKDIKGYRESGANQGIPFEAYLGQVQHNRQFDKDAAQKLVDKQVKDQQAKEKAVADNALKDAQTKRTLGDMEVQKSRAELAKAQAENVGKPKPMSEGEAARLKAAGESQDWREDLAKSKVDEQVRRDVANELGRFSMSALREASGAERHPTPEEVSAHMKEYVAKRSGAAPAGTAGTTTQPPPNGVGSGGGEAPGAPATSTQPFKPPAGFSPYNASLHDKEGATGFNAKGEPLIYKGGVWIRQ